MTDSLESHLAACAEIVRRHDRERYLVCLFAEPDARAGLFALLAANHEIAKTAEVVSDPMIGHIRLQWWREAFEGIEAGTPRAHEVVLPLAAVAETTPEVLGHLGRIVDAREADLSGEPLPDLEALIAYAAETGGEAAAAMARVLGADVVAARHLGTAWALIGLVRALPALLAVGRMPLPESLLQENGVNISRIRDMPGSVDLTPICRPIVREGRDRLRRATAEGALRSKNARPLRLLSARAGDLAGSLERAGFDPRAPGVAEMPTGLVWRHAMRAVCYRFW
ncbi:MAG: squalene/phytoene synthase family protein [Alphaproteobacteria bacterium]|nr:squalene/phytoene synthase family protein [Alphaproteobacteria bacterium]